MRVWKMSKINKPWGYEELLEHNEKYVMKKLFMKKGKRCSLQYHKKKKETVFVVSGKLELELHLEDMEGLNNTKSAILFPGDFLTIRPFQTHRMMGLEDSVYLEASTPELDDVVRLQDDYGRKDVESTSND